MAAVTADEILSRYAFVAVGSNLGEKKGNCLRGIESLAASGDTQVVECSRFYQTEPVDYLDQDWFVNAVVKVKTRLDPHGLLETLLAVEASLGRKRQSAVRFGPRIIDLDLIFYGPRRIESDGLVLPHPRMHKRRFVLEPICDIEPELLHPVLNRTVRQLLADPDVGCQKLIRLGE